MVPKLKEKDKIGHKEAMSKAGELWHSMSEKEKEPYVTKNTADVAR